jgi:hypothetical protein
MKRVFIDIETVPPERDNQRLPDHLAQLGNEEFRRLSLDGVWGRILCICLIIEQGERNRRLLLGMDPATRSFHLDEARTLNAFWRLLADFDVRYDLLCGFNLLDFDLLFIYQRSIINRIKPTVQIPFKRFCSRPIYDVMWCFTQWRRRISLDEVSRALGLESSKQDGIDGSRVYDLYLAGEHEAIADYCERDTLLVQDIFKRLNFIEQREEFIQ